jgi:hypothetical protein
MLCDNAQPPGLRRVQKWEEDMRKLFWLGVLAAAFYGHSRFVFSEPAMMSGEDGMCDGYASDLRFEIRSTTARGAMLIDGDKEDLCEYLKDASAAFRATGASVNNNIELIGIEPSGFPWMSATVKLRQSSTVRMRGAPAIIEVVETTTVVRRTLRGREIAQFDSSSEASLGQ